MPPQLTCRRLVEGSEWKTGRVTSAERAIRRVGRRLPALTPSRDHLLEWTVGAVIAVASITGIVTQIVAETPLLGWVPLAVTLGGFTLSSRMRWPGIVLAACGPVLGGVFGFEPVLVWTLTVFAAFLWCLRGASGLVVAPLVGVANYLAFLIDGRHDWTDPLALIALSVTVAAAAAGSAIAARRQFLAEARQRLVEARLTRDAEIERRISEERLRIARDLHDMVGHETAVVNMHLGAAEVHLPEGADRSRADLEAARRGVQAVIRETHQILDILRLTPGDDATAPNADFDHLAGLIGSYRELGVGVDAHLDPAPVGLAPEVSAATYRVVQECLTNAQKHGTGPVSITVRGSEDEIRITVSNAVRTLREPSEGGYGLIGMRERVASVGGTLEVGLVGRMFTVRATMRTNGRRT